MPVFDLHVVPNEESNAPDNVMTWTWTEICDLCGEVIRSDGSFEANHKPNRSTYRCYECALEKIESKN